MTLSAQLQTFQNGMLERVGPENADTIRRNIDGLIAAGVADRALRAGDTAPEVVLPDQHGNTVSLTARLATGPVALLFYRGGWSPLCELTLRAWQASLPALRAAGADVLAISPDDQAAALETATSNWLHFPLLSDTENTAAAAFGLDYAMPRELRALYHRFNVKIGKRCCAWRLPICSTYIIAPDRTIRSAMVDLRSTVRMDPKDALRLLREMQPRRAA